MIIASADKSHILRPSNGTMLCACVFVCLPMYVCSYVYPSHSACLIDIVHCAQSISAYSLLCARIPSSLPACPSMSVSICLASFIVSQSQ